MTYLITPCLVLYVIDAVDALVENQIAKTRKEAVWIGRTLARELNLFRHVTGDHAFSDDYLFFRFRHDADDDSSSSQSRSSHSSSAGDKSLQRTSDISGVARDLSVLVENEEENSDDAF